MEAQAKRPLKIVIIVAAAMIGFWAIRQWRTPAEVVPWRTDLQSAQAEAAQQGKPLLVYFTADWCPPCQHMKRTTWADPRVANALKDYVPVKIDVDHHQDLARKYGVTGIPRVQLMLSNGQTGQSIVGAVAADDMVEWLK